MKIAKLFSLPSNRNRQWNFLMFIKSTDVWPTSNEFYFIYARLFFFPSDCLIALNGVTNFLSPAAASFINFWLH